MLWYVKENGWYYSRVHGPYNSREEAERHKPSDLLSGRLDEQIEYEVFESKELL